MDLLMRQIFRLSFAAVGVVLLAAACAPTSASQLSASGAWVRATGTSPTDSTEVAPPLDAASTMDSAEAMSGHAMGEAGEMEEERDTMSAAYLTLRNAGATAERLVSAATSAAEVAEIHTSEMDSQGVMRMRPVTDGLEIPAGGSVTLEPGGYHIMLIQLKQALVPGETITLTLNFASGATLEVTAEVRLP